MMEALQGTTPTLEITIPQDIPVSNIIGIELTMRHKASKQKYGLSDVTVDSETNTISYRFAEAQTLALDPDYPLWWQLRVKTASGIVGTDKYQIDVKDLMSEDVME